MLAGRLGTHTIALTATDEARAWVQTLRAVEKAMPCPVCRAHYKEWRIAHPFEGMMQLRGAILRDTAQRWLWDLHCAVNARRPSGGTDAPADYDACCARYSACTVACFQKELELLVQHLLRAVQFRQVKAESVKEFRAALWMIRKFTSLF
jgi:hypothetical protein